MPTVDFAHGFAFDPAYGHTLDTLLQLPPPPEPADFAAFWQSLFAQARAVRVAPQLRQIGKRLQRVGAGLLAKRAFNSRPAVREQARSHR